MQAWLPVHQIYQGNCFPEGTDPTAEGFDPLAAVLTTTTSSPVETTSTSRVRKTRRISTPGVAWRRKTVRVRQAQGDTLEPLSQLPLRDRFNRKSRASGIGRRACAPPPDSPHLRRRPDIAVAAAKHANSSPQTGSRISMVPSAVHRLGKITCCSAPLFAFPFPPTMPFRAIVEPVLPGAFGYHPEFASIDWAKANGSSPGRPGRRTSTSRWPRTVSRHRT